jgi:hypothetical protein
MHAPHEVVYPNGQASRHPPRVPPVRRRCLCIVPFTTAAPTAGGTSLIKPGARAASSNLEVLVGSEVVHTCFAGLARVPREEARVAVGARAGEGGLRLAGFTL